MCTEMKSFSERNPLMIAAIGASLTAACTVTALNYDKLPFVHSRTAYSAYFAEAGGLVDGASVQVSGFSVGEVTGVSLDGDKVLITFDVDSDVRIGDRSEAFIRTKSLLGGKELAITPRGDGHLAAPIPLERTTPPYQLPDALGDLSSTVSQLNTTGFSDALATVAQTFHDTPPQLQVAVQGLGRLTATIDSRDRELRSLLANARKVTGVLAERTDQIVGLVNQADALLVQLLSQSNALDELSADLSAFAKQLSGFVADNRDQFKPALDKLNGVLTIVDNRKERIQQAVKYLNAYAMSLGESVATGPFFKSYLVNLLPGQFIQPFVDAAFSDLGLDPNVKLPSELSDPQTGQPGTPALPVPFPRTGQGGEPRLNLPDAITGKPGDPRYPYREPLPAPPPGGPPPGPPALPAPGVTP